MLLALGAAFVSTSSVWLVRSSVPPHAVRPIAVFQESSPFFYDTAPETEVLVTTDRAGDAPTREDGDSVAGHSEPGVGAPSPTLVSLEPCGGDLPPCVVKQRESGGDYGAYNPTGCNGLGCFGAWQLSGEWAGKLGLPMDLSTATPEQQDNAARLLWNGGAGCSNWSACA